MNITEFGSYGVVKVAGAEPEVFWIVWANPKEPESRGLFLRTSDNMTETEVRSELEKIGLREGKIDSLIERARANPA